MRAYEGRVVEIRLKSGHATAAWIDCPREAIPAPGRYLLAWAPEDQNAPLAVPLFAGGLSEGDSRAGFLAAPPLPGSWMPGARLVLRGPLGRGFDLPTTARRLALAALGKTVDCLLPLVQQALDRELAVAMFTDDPFTSLPSAVELHLLSALPESLWWADFLALASPLESVPEIRRTLGVEPGGLPVLCPSQALIVTEMPCGGSADCGACGVETRRGWKLACKDGPVFDLNQLIY